MDEIQRLLRVAARRNRADEYEARKFRILKVLNASFRRQLEEDRITPNVFLEAIVRGYVNRHPAILAMLDQWVRDEVPEKAQPSSIQLSRRELEDIYKAAHNSLTEDK